MTLGLRLGVRERTLASPAWTAPIGIPDPPFGITEEAPALPSPWTSEVAGFYYINGSTGTDSGRTYGTPSAPRLTIPNPVPAGAVVMVAGTYSSNYGGPTLDLDGTSSSPSFIRGVDGNSVTGTWIVTGSYTVIEGLNFYQTSATILAPADHVCIRGCDVTGTLAGDGGVHIQCWGSSNLSYCVIYDNAIHHSGDWQTEEDQDSHGTNVYCSSEATGTISYVWLLNNVYSYNSGDAVQINAGIGRADQVHHIYMGYCESHHNKQTGGWTKDATHVIFSENYSHDHVSSPSSSGSGFGWQDGPEYVWFLFNRSTNNEVGILHAAADEGTPDHHYYIGNRLWGNSAAGLQLNGQPPLSAEMVLNNTCYDNPIGIEDAYGSGCDAVLSGNILASCSGAQLSFPGADVTIRNCLFDSPFDVVYGSTYSSLASFRGGTGEGDDCVVGSPDFVNAAGGDFNLQATSDAIGVGASEAAYATFYSLYGIDIAVDADRRSRPQGGTWDAGAYEYPG